MIDLTKRKLGPFFGLRNVLILLIGLMAVIAFMYLAPPDRINGLFEIGGSLFCGLSVWKLYCDKQVRGVSWITTGFFAAWGFWNIYFYSHLGQWCSLVGGVALALVNAFYVALMLYYIRKEERCAS